MQLREDNGQYGNYSGKKSARTKFHQIRNDKPACIDWSGHLRMVVSDINSRSLRAKSSTESNGTQTVQIPKDLLEKSCRMLTPTKYEKESSLFPDKNGWGRPEERAKKYGVYRVTVWFYKCSVRTESGGYRLLPSTSGGRTAICFRGRCQRQEFLRKIWVRNNENSGLLARGSVNFESSDTQPRKIA